MMPTSTIPYVSRLITAELAGDFMTEASSLFAEPALLGDSPAMRRLRSQIGSIAPHLRVALIIGTTPANSDAVAHELHRLGPVAQQPFTSTSAAALNEAVTAADVRFLLGLEGTPGGAIYIKNVDRLQTRSQQLLLLVLNGVRNTEPRLRLIASAQRPLQAGIGDRFHPELFQVLTPVTLRFPRLAERADDLPQLAAALLCQWANRTGHNPPTLGQEALELLQLHSWPGDQEELEDVLLRASIRAHGGLITRELVEPMLLQPATMQASMHSAETASLKLQEVVDRHILEVLRAHNGNKVRAAEALGISRSTLYRMLEQITPTHA